MVRVPLCRYFLFPENRIAHNPGWDNLPPFTIFYEGLEKITTLLLPNNQPYTK